MNLNLNIMHPALETLIPLIDWDYFFAAWEMKGKGATPEGETLKRDALVYLEKRIIKPRLVYKLFPCRKDGLDIVLLDKATKKSVGVLHTLRQQARPKNDASLFALSDFVEKEDDYVGMYVATAGRENENYIQLLREKGDDYQALLAQSMADRVAEACSCYAESLLQACYDNPPKHVIRPAPGYPSQPDHSEKYELFRLLNATNNIGVTLTENAMMQPVSSVCALFFANAHANYFSLGKIGLDQALNYAKRKGWDEQQMRHWLGHCIAE